MVINPNACKNSWSSSSTNHLRIKSSSLGKLNSKPIVNIKNTIPNSTKFGGATGNFNAHHLAYPKKVYEVAKSFTEKRLGLNYSFPTTQIEHYDNMAATFDNLSRINTIFNRFK